MASCNEHVECLQEEIEDRRHLEDIGLVFISIGIASLGLSTIPTYAIAGVILVVAGMFLFIFDERKKNRAEAKLCELLKRLSESQKGS
ncbi:MAG: hypothetical protein DSO07_02160 [Thermoproteota archaeon]|jgi:hypothetical protein|uniref:Uncharacterized protein n=1 Tax=Candidatus Methanodesulfokora washburnensis TaxID=2478471 RepID=A0A429GQY3_9CREN|nr:hypothetical protein D6D85_04900 [Candidatus Methanodesulfokores washburnensis]TDA41891.1 MAG: hypothetical protein DSO07_02160 [Candidatus Korarchaeota archaeon]